LVRPERAHGLVGRISRSRLRRNVEKRIEVERILEWRRLAPSGSPLWVLPDSELEAVINRLAASSRARTVELTYYLAEFERRQRRQLNERLAEANRKMVVLTQAVLVLTGVSVALAALGTVTLLT
jgi:hypothetical protein